MLDIGKFARPILTSPEGATQFRFGGASAAEIATELHAFADAVALGKVMVMKIQGTQVVSPEDYFAQALLVEFVEREREPGPGPQRAAPERIIDLPSV